MNYIQSKFIRLGDLLININDVATIKRNGNTVEVTHIGGQIISKTNYDDYDSCRTDFNILEKALVG